MSVHVHFSTSTDSVVGGKKRTWLEVYALCFPLNVLSPLTRVGSRLARFHQQFLHTCGANL
jgi:hypothetical protein